MSEPAIHEVAAQGIRVALDLALGQLARFEVRHAGRIIAPFARVPWADQPEDALRFGPAMPPHLRRMSGDFFCAPFCADDIEGAPLHGWTANSSWTFLGQTSFEGGVTARFRLDRRVAGAVVEKHWTLRDNHPFLYQEHRFVGGTGTIPMAHHAMVDLRTGGLLCFSPKLWAETPTTPLEQDRSVLRYAATGRDLRAFPGQTGPVDLTRYPIAARHEDFVMLIDDPAQDLGWVTVLRPMTQDVAVLVKPVAQLPQTMLWFSNGGRDPAPWNGEHLGVLGIEEACALGSEGWAAATLPNRLTERGIRTAIDLGAAKTVSVRTAMGAFACGAHDAQSAKIEDDRVVLHDGTAVPFHAAHLRPTPRTSDTRNLPGDLLDK